MFPSDDEPRRGMPLVIKCVLIALLLLPLMIYVVSKLNPQVGLRKEQPRKQAPVHADLENMRTFRDHTFSTSVAS